jgi:flagellin
MSVRVNTNVDAFEAQRNIGLVSMDFSKAVQQLSSGLRINSAADDAAGLAISQQFTTQINGTNQAVNNANDAVSETQTASGAINTIVNNLQSIRTLAVEAANGSNSASDRQALDAQVQQQISEITQIAQQTSFNGLSVLNGSSGVTTYQVGANVGNTISINLTQGVGATQIGQVASSSVKVGTAALTGNLTLAVGTAAAVTVGASVAGALPGQTAGSAFAKAQAVNAANISGLTASASNTATEAAAFVNIVAPTAGTGGSPTGTTYALSINGVNIYSGTGNVAVGTTLTVQQVASQINLFSSQDGNVTASVAAGKLTLTAADGSDINISQTITAGTAGTGGAAGSGTGIDTSISGGVAGAGKVNSGTLTLEANSNIAVAGSDAGGAIGQAAGSIALGTSTLANQNVQTVAGANATIQAVDSALQTVSSFQSQLGAIQNRFTAAVGNLQSTAQNLTQSRSTIQDANFAAETANLTQAQVLEQAGISVLAQANQQPQLILKLLQ